MLEPWAWRHKWWKKWPYYLAVEGGCSAAPPPCSPPAIRKPRGCANACRVSASRRCRSGSPARRGRTTRPRARNSAGAPASACCFSSRACIRRKGWSFCSKRWPPSRGEPLRLVVVGDGDPDYVRSLKALAERLATQPAAHRLDRPGLGRGALAVFSRRGSFLPADVFGKLRPRRARGAASRDAGPHDPHHALGLAARTAARLHLRSAERERRGSAAAPGWRSPRSDRGRARRKSPHWAHARFAWKNLCPIPTWRSIALCGAASENARTVRPSQRGCPYTSVGTVCHDRMAPSERASRAGAASPKFFAGSRPGPRNHEQIYSLSLPRGPS